MVYNEGFDILINDRSYFAFSKYSKNNNEKKNINTKWVSKCYSTLVGWYHIGKHKWGCFYAKKIIDNPDKVTNGEPNGKLVVVEGAVKKVDNTVEINQNRFKYNRFKSIGSKISNNKDISISPKHLIDQKINKNNYNQKSVVLEDADQIIDSLSSQLSFIETSEKLNISSDFKDHKQVVDKINSITDLWEATNYNEFSSMTIEQLNKYAGRKKKSLDQLIIKEDKEINSINDHDSDLLSTFTSYSGLKNIIKQTSKQDLPRFEYNYQFKNKDAKYKDLPKNHSDMKYMFKARNQGSCGSCYVMATTSMLEARIRKQTNNKIKERISVQQILSCSVYNQGCDGGYPYLAMKFGSEVELVPEKCMRYKVIFLNINIFFQD